MRSVYDIAAMMTWWCNVTNFILSRDSKILFTEAIKNFHFFDNEIKFLLEKDKLWKLRSYLIV